MLKESPNGMMIESKGISLVEYIYVTVSCIAITPITKRDMKKNNIIEELSDVSGTAEGMLFNTL